MSAPLMWPWRTFSKLSTAYDPWTKRQSGAYFR